jgi:hypothetical protein
MIRKVAGKPMIGRIALQLWFHFAAQWLRLGTTRAEAAARRRIRGIGHVAGQDNALSGSFPGGIRDRYGGQEGLRVRVAGVCIENVAIGNFNDLAQIHYRNAVAQMTDDR